MMKRGHDVGSAQASGDGEQPWSTMPESTCHWNSRACALWTRRASGFGLEGGVGTAKGFGGRIRELVSGHITLERIAGAMLSARATLKVEYEKLHKIVLAIVREDAVCRRLMTVPSVGPLVAITYKTAMDDPNRITKSKAAGALFGLTPKKYQSGEKDVTGGITRTGDEMVRTALYEAANVLLARITRFSKLKRWGMDVAKRRGPKRAKVALARKIGVILPRMWIDGTTYRCAAAMISVHRPVRTVASQIQAHC